MEIIYVVGLFGWLTAAWRWGKREDLEKYHPTILLMILGDILYNFLTCTHPLWRYESPNLHIKHTIVDLTIAAIAFPSTVILYLSYYPQSLAKQIAYITGWTLLYSVLEWFCYSVRLFSYHNGWNIWWSVLHNIFTFVVLILHQRKPSLAYTAFVVISFFFIFCFGISLSDIQ